MAKSMFPRLFYNKISVSGLALAIITGFTILFFLIVRSGQGEENPYLGILTYMALPPFLLLGLLLVPIGAVRQWRRAKKYGIGSLPEQPRIDFDNPAHRRAIAIFLGGGVIYCVISVIGAYQAYHYTESVSFCGETCHEVMKPEHVAYQNSPHARVACVDCHVGAGADWYAKSKLSGAYQVYATAFNKYPRPIPTPIKNLRPAQETCEQCHWPKKFFGNRQREYRHFMYDDENTEWRIDLLIKTGGADPTFGHGTGIHWHMNINVKVEYIARDELRQDIPWIRVTDRTTGRVSVYQDEDDPLTEEELQTMQPRVMDCLDCHNRPSHQYNSPDYIVDLGLRSERIDKTLPSFKSVAVGAMDRKFETEDEAFESIAGEITDYYRSNYPDLFENDEHTIQQAVLAVQHGFSQNMFPEMKVRWKDYPNNVGHLIFPGCMRCHDGNKVSDDGITITRECTTCHVILAQGPVGDIEMATSPEGLEFRHPDGDDDWRDTGCNECHEGIAP